MSTAATDNPATQLAGALKPYSRTALAQRIRLAALSVDGVAGVGSNAPVQVATYGLPGETVRGVRVTKTGNHLEIELHVVARLVPLEALGERIRAAVQETLVDWHKAPCVNVYIDDLDESP